MTKTLEQSDIAKRVTSVLKKHGVTKAALFGSVARGDTHSDSDVDILVELPDGVGLLDFIGIQHEIEDTLGREVDLVTYQGIKPALRQYILDGPQIKLI